MGATNHGSPYFFGYPMPIKGDAKKVKKSMEGQYGKEEGERVFYATANKQGRKPETWKKKASVQILTSLLRARK